MQINNNGITNSTNTNSKQTPVGSESNKKTSTESTNQAGQDSVFLSQEAQVLKQLEAKIADSPAVDMAKVDSIRQAIADGSYSINAESIASKMLNMDNE